MANFAGNVSGVEVQDLDGEMQQLCCDLGCVCWFEAA